MFWNGPTAGKGRRDPSNKILLKERGDLFKQVGLLEVADLDYSAAKTKG